MSQSQSLRALLAEFRSLRARSSGDPRTEISRHILSIENECREMEERSLEEDFEDLRLKAHCLRSALDATGLRKYAEECEGWKKVSNLAAVPEPRLTSSRSLEREALRLSLSLIAWWGMDVVLHYNLFPSHDNLSEEIEYLRSAVEAADCFPDVHLAFFRLNLIVKWRLNDDISSQDFCKPPPIGDASRWQIQHQDIRQLANWDTTRDMMGAEKQAELEDLCPKDFHLDKYGLLFRIDFPATSKRRISEAAVPSKRPKSAGSSKAEKPTDEMDIDSNHAGEEYDGSGGAEAMEQSTDAIANTADKFHDSQKGKSLRTNQAVDTLWPHDVSAVQQSDTGALVRIEVATAGAESRPEFQAVHDFVAVSSSHEIARDFKNNWRESRAQLRALYRELGETLVREARPHNELAGAWIEGAELPVFSEHIGSLCDVYKMSPDALDRALDDGHILKKPVLIQGEPFRDSHLHSISRYTENLAQISESLDTQVYGLKQVSKISVKEVQERMLQEEQDNEVSSAPENILNMRAHGKAQVPLFTRHDRLLLLEQASAHGKDAGKQIRQWPVDIDQCSSFAIMATSLAFSGPHVDILNGTWVRCLRGLKGWLIAVDLTDEEWQAFQDTGDDWQPPEGKIRMILLEKDDVLLMPPGIRVVHAPVTITPCIMEGGMLWDQRNIIETLRNVKLACEHPTITNENIPLQLHSILEGVRKVAGANPARFHDTSQTDAEFLKDLEEAIRNVRKLGCKCTQTRTGGCPVDTCPCIERNSRCTDMCTGGKHTRAVNHMEACVNR